ncbi:MAG TPA: type II toxin-antitoxin system PemK/MazF family toxin [Polyangia bacterium]
MVLVGFVFADESGKKLRPALVVSSRAYHRGRHEVIVAAITSNVGRRLPGDHPVSEWKSAGLLFPSVVTGILRTITREMVERRLGVLARGDLDAVDDHLRRALAL